MRLSLKAFALACSLLWGGAILLVSLINLAAATYADGFLRLMSSVYPGFDFTRDIVDILIGTAYGLVDGALAGLVFAWLYNAFAKPLRPV